MLRTPFTFSNHISAQLPTTFAVRILVVVPMTMMAVFMPVGVSFHSLSILSWVNLRCRLRLSGKWRLKMKSPPLRMSAVRLLLLFLRLKRR